MAQNAVSKAKRNIVSYEWEQVSPLLKKRR